MAMKIGIAVIVIIGVLLAFIATRPASFRIARSATINAPADALFGMVNDFHRWPAWSPWEKLDANMKRTFEGPPSGPGSIYSWVGNSKAGEGRMTILDSTPGQLVAIKLEFFKPFAATNQTNFTFTPSASGTQVAWTMEGTHGFMSKAFSMFTNMDKLVGGDFERGLANMNAASVSRTP